MKSENEENTVPDTPHTQKMEIQGKLMRIASYCAEDHIEDEPIQMKMIVKPKVPRLKLSKEDLDTASSNFGTEVDLNKQVSEASQKMIDQANSHKIVLNKQINFLETQLLTERETVVTEKNELLEKIADLEKQIEIKTLTKKELQEKVSIFEDQIRSDGQTILSMTKELRDTHKVNEELRAKEKGMENQLLKTYDNIKTQQSIIDDTKLKNIALEKKIEARKEVFKQLEEDMKLLQDRNARFKENEKVFIEANDQFKDNEVVLSEKYKNAKKMVEELSQQFEDSKLQLDETKANHEKLKLDMSARENQFLKLGEEMNEIQKAQAEGSKNNDDNEKLVFMLKDHVTKSDEWKKHQKETETMLMKENLELKAQLGDHNNGRSEITGENSMLQEKNKNLCDELDNLRAKTNDKLEALMNAQRIQREKIDKLETEKNSKENTMTNNKVQQQFDTLHKYRINVVPKINLATISTHEYDTIADILPSEPYVDESLKCHEQTNTLINSYQKYRDEHKLAKQEQKAYVKQNPQMIEPSISHSKLPSYQASTQAYNARRSASVNEIRGNKMRHSNSEQAYKANKKLSKKNFNRSCSRQQESVGLIEYEPINRPYSKMETVQKISATELLESKLKLYKHQQTQQQNQDLYTQESLDGYYKNMSHQRKESNSYY